MATFSYFTFGDMLYCIEITRPFEDKMVVHERFDHKPLREEIISFVDTLDCGYNDKDGKIEYYQVD